MPDVIGHIPTMAEAIDTTAATGMTGVTGTTGTEEVTRDVATQEEDTIFSCSKSQEENLIAVKTSVPVYKMILTFISKKYWIKLQINRK